MSAALPDLSPLGRGTLGRRLMVRMLLLVTLIAVVLSVATALATWQSMMLGVDRQLDAAFSRQDRPGYGFDGERPLPPGQPAGTIVVQSRGNAFWGYILHDDLREYEEISFGLGADLLDLPTDGQPQTINLRGYGSYRAKALLIRGTTQVVAIPLTEVDRTMHEMLQFALIMTAGALLAAVVLVRAVVVRSLEPLNRLASTAREVSQLELARGEVHVPMRVAAKDADPRSEVGRVGYALNHLLGNVEEALAARQASETKVRQFVADASHELRNPLASVKGYAELTRRDRSHLPPDTARAMERIEAEADRMSKLVEDLLLLARLDSQPDLELRRIDVAEIAVNATSDAQVAYPAYDWGVDLPEEHVFARADAHRLHQVLANLLANAGKHTPPGTVVTTAVRAHGPAVIITVTDNGPGIPPEVQATVFERFVRADVARTRSGPSKDSTGLGLAIVAAVMEAHGGWAAVHSHPGGTVFTLGLPRA